MASLLCLFSTIALMNLETAIANTIFINESDPKSSLHYYLCSNMFQLQSDTVLLLSHLQEHVLYHHQVCVITNISNITLQSLYPTIVSCNSTTGIAFLDVSTVSLVNIEFTNCGGQLHARLFQDLPKDVFYFSFNQSTTLLFINCSDISFFNINITLYYGFASIFINPNGYSILHNIAIITSNGPSRCKNLINPDISCTGAGIVIYYVNELVDKSIPVSNFTITQGIIKYNFNLPLHIKKPQTLDQIFAKPSIPVSKFGASLTILFSKGKYIANISMAHLDMLESYAAYFGGLAAMFANAPLETTMKISKSKFKYQIDWSPSSRIGIYMYLNKSYVYDASRVWTPLIIEDTKFSNRVSMNAMYEAKMLNYGNIYIGVDQQDEFLHNRPNIAINIILRQLNYHQDFTGYRSPFLYAETCNTPTSRYPVVKMLNLNITDCNLFSGLSSTFTSLNYGMLMFVSLASVTFNGNNSFIKITGSVLQAINTNLHFKGVQKFIGNQANHGAGIRLESSILYIHDTSHTEFHNNRASFYGGAIYSHSTQLPNNIPACAIQIVGNKLDKVRMVFVNNSAAFSGNSIYVTSLYNCVQNQHTSIGNIILYQTVFSFKNSNNGLSPMSSEPVRVCFCDFNNPSNLSCIDQSELIIVHLGSMLTFGFIAQDELNVSTHGLIEATLQIAISRHHAKIDSLIRYVNYLIPVEQRIQTVYGNRCTPLSYTLQDSKLHSLFFNMQFAVAGLAPSLVVPLHLVQCPIGFTLDSQTNNCNCSHFLQKNRIIYCHINTKTIQVPQRVWIGKQNSSNLLQYASHCPLGYCNNDRKSLNISSIRLEDLCDGNRVGTLCGQCKEGYSIVSSTSLNANCMKCSNTSLYILPVYLIGALLYVLAMYTFKFTIDIGTVGGLNFWIVFMSSFMSPYIIDSKIGYIGNISMYIISLLVSKWFKPLCIWNGLNSLQWAACEFFISVYFWIIVGMIVLVSKLSSRVANFAVGSSVQVLATLMYLSFSSVISNAIRILTPSYIYIENTTAPELVWYWDGTIDYGHNTYHILLLIVSCLALVGFILPYLVMALFGTVLLRYHCISKYCRPFIDAFHGPYKAGNYRWFGYRLVLLTILQALSVINGLTDVQPFLYAIILTIFALVQATIMPFKNLLLNVIDIWFMFLLILTSIAILAFGNDNHITANVSPLLALLTSLCILCYHLFIGLGRIHCLRYKAMNYYDRCSQWYNTVLKKQKENQYEPINDVTESLSGFREPLNVIYYKSC